MAPDGGNFHTLISRPAPFGAWGLCLATCSLLAACAPAGAADTARPEQASAAAPSATVTADSASQIPAAETFVLVWFDARLHRTPQDDAPLWAYDFGSTTREQHPGQVHVARVLERRGEWRLVGGVTRWLDVQSHPVHCIGSGIFDANGLDIAVWVHERDLAPVLRDRFERRFDDGTFVSLNSGVPVVAGMPWADGYWFPVEPPAEIVGLEYLPGQAHERDGEGSLFLLDSFAASLGGLPVAWAMPVWSYADKPMATLTLIDGEPARLHGSGCGGFELSVQGSFEALGPGGLVGGMRASSNESRAGAVKAGAPLLWPDGTSAGTVVDDLTRQDLTPGPEALTCMSVPVGRALKTERYRNELASVCVETARIEAVTMN